MYFKKSIILKSHTHFCLDNGIKDVVLKVFIMNSYTYPNKKKYWLVYFGNSWDLHVHHVLHRHKWEFSYLIDKWIFGHEIEKAWGYSGWIRSNIYNYNVYLFLIVSPTFNQFQAFCFCFLAQVVVRESAVSFYLEYFLFNSSYIMLLSFNYYRSELL